MSRLLSAFAVVLLSSQAFASTGSFGVGHIRTDESDLTGSRIRIHQSVPNDLPADSVRATAATTPLTVEVARTDHGRATPVSGLALTLSQGSQAVSGTTDENGIARFSALPTCSSRTPSAKLVAALANAQFEVNNSSTSENYRIVADVPCGGKAQLTFKQDSNGGQALGIWQVASRARAKLQQSIGLNFWKSKITFVWPDSADYYNWGTVHITRGDQWDVVGHEMGHGIYDLGKVGQFGGGEHKIDECYSQQLALSEGWASYFSGWVSLSLADTDAKFEYMVPRRAPIRFENIPEDVCKGERNEWRVTGFFWDLIDLHDDHETMNETFARTWKALEGSRIPSASAAYSRLQKAGIDSKALELIWDLNFRSPIRK